MGNVSPNGCQTWHFITQKAPKRRREKDESPNNLCMPFQYYSSSFSCLKMKQNEWNMGGSLSKQAVAPDSKHFRMKPYLPFPSPPYPPTPTQTDNEMRKKFWLCVEFLGRDIRTAMKGVFVCSPLLGSEKQPKIFWFFFKFLACQ